MEIDDLTKRKIKNTIEKNKDTYIIFYSPSCPFSQEALNILRMNKLNYKGYNVNNSCYNLNQLVLYLESINFIKNHKTIPIIFYESKFIGGYTELSNILI